MKWVMSTGLSILIGIAAWILFPTHVPAATHYVNAFSPETFIEMKRRLADYGASASRRGVVVRGDIQSSGAMAVYCRALPVMVLSDAPGETIVLQTYPRSISQTPSAAPVSEDVLELMRGLGPVASRPSGEPTGALNDLVLDIRDGVDPDAACG
jgi:hypothetical protein